MHKVSIVVGPGMRAFEIALAYEVFSTRTASHGQLYELSVVGDDPISPGPFHVRPDARLRGLVHAQTVIVPALEDVDAEPDPRLVSAVRDARAAGARIVSLCTGAFVLAAAGLLDGRRAATHWAHAAAFRERHPRVQVDADVLYVDDGDLLTSAGKAAALDLCLHLVRRDHGAAAANAIARSLVVPPHRVGGQAQFLELPVAPDAGALALTFDWARERLGGRLTVSELARHANVSERTLSRWFRSQAGTTPLQWLLSQRVERARELLESTRLTVETIADEVGLGSAVSLRRHFSRVLGISPDAYRRAFRP